MYSMKGAYLPWRQKSMLKIFQYLDEIMNMNCQSRDTFRNFRDTFRNRSNI